MVTIKRTDKKTGKEYEIEIGRRKIHDLKRSMRCERSISIMKNRKNKCKNCGHHKFFEKPKGIFCTKCNKRKK